MSRRIAQLAALLVVATAATVALSPLAARITLSGACGLALVIVLRSLPRPLRRSAFDDALREPAPVSVEPPELARMRGLLLVAHGRRLHAIAELTPILRTIAQPRLAARGLALDENARGVLGDDLWELARPDQTLPNDRTERGPSIAELRRTLDALESL